MSSTTSDSKLPGCYWYRSLIFKELVLFTYFPDRWGSEIIKKEVPKRAQLVDALTSTCVNCQQATANRNVTDDHNTKRCPSRAHDPWLGPLSQVQIKRQMPDEKDKKTHIKRGTKKFILIGIHNETIRTTVQLEKINCWFESICMHRLFFYRRHGRRPFIETVTESKLHNKGIDGAVTVGRYGVTRTCGRHWDMQAVGVRSGQTNGIAGPRLGRWRGRFSFKFLLPDRLGFLSRVNRSYIEIERSLVVFFSSSSYSFLTFFADFSAAGLNGRYISTER